MNFQESSTPVTFFHMSDRDKGLAFNQDDFGAETQRKQT